MKQTISKSKKQLLRQFHTVCSKTGMQKHEKEIMYESMGIQSSTELSEKQLEEAIAALNSAGDKWRKRVIAAVSAWCHDVNIGHDIDKVKAIACRASGYKYFNQIPVSRLRDVYYEFVRKSRTTVAARNIKEEIVNFLENNN